MSHRSWCAEHPGERSNERLEFLGDAVLGLVVTDDIFAALPDVAEGHLAKIRAQVVCAPSLAGVAVDLRVGPALRLGRGEEMSGGREKASILADAVEALFGAVWLDGGLTAAAPVVRTCMAAHLADAVARPGELDAKTGLQETAAHLGEGAPHYDVVEEGPDHAKHFTATVLLSGRPWGVGSGRTKKEAEQAAAADALGQLASHGGVGHNGGGGGADA